MRSFLILLLVACTALAQDQADDSPFVTISRAEFKAIEVQMAWLKAKLAEKERAEREEKIRLGCT